MTEEEFIRFYKKRNKSKNHEVVKEKIDLFWNVLLKALEEDKKITFKDWGSFEKKEVKSRKIVLPMWEQARYTKPKRGIRFKAGLAFVRLVNRNSDTDE